MDRILGGSAIATHSIEIHTIWLEPSDWSQTGTPQQTNLSLGGKLEFGFHHKAFPTDMEEYFLLFEDKCSQLHTCAGRVMGIQAHARESVIEPPSYDPRDIVALVEKYGDAHVSDSGWRVVDREEWYADNWDYYQLGLHY